MRLAGKGELRALKQEREVGWERARIIQNKEKTEEMRFMGCYKLKLRSCFPSVDLDSSKSSRLLS